MTTGRKIFSLIEPLIAAQRDGEIVRVDTACLFADGGTVSVIVRQSKSGFDVSDDGAGFRHLLSLGIDRRQSHERLALEVADDMGVVWQGGSFAIRHVGEGSLPAAIAIVANATQRWVGEIVRNRRVEAERDLSERLHERVHRIFSDHAVSHRVAMIGETTRQYEVDTVVQLQSRKLLIEPVTSHPNSLAGTFLKFSDLARAHPEDSRECVVSELARWRAEDVNVLNEVSTGISDIETGLPDWRKKYAA